MSARDSLSDVGKLPKFHDLVLSTLAAQCWEASIARRAARDVVGILVPRDELVGCAIDRPSNIPEYARVFKGKVGSGVIPNEIVSRHAESLEYLDHGGQTEIEARI